MSENERSENERSDEESSAGKEAEEGIDAEIVGNDEVIETEEAGQVARRMQFEAWMGPLPPPRDFQAYEEVLPGSADRILEMAETQMAHRHTMEAKTLDRSYWGLAAGFIVVLTLLIAGVYVILQGHAWAGFGIISVDLVSLVSVFMYGSRLPRRGRSRFAGGRSENEGPPVAQS